MPLFKVGSIDKISCRGHIFELRLNRVELIHMNKSTTDCIVINLPPKQIDGLTEDSKQKTINALGCEIVFCYNDENSTYLFCPSNPQLSLSTSFPACTHPLITEFDDLN